MSMLKRSAGVMLMALAVVLMPLSAQATVYDYDHIYQLDDHAIDAKTDICRSYVLTQVQGSPGAPDTSTAWTTNYNSGCNVGVRFRYVPSGGTSAVWSSWEYAIGKNQFYYTIKNVWRCNTQIAIRRSNGTRFTIMTNTVYENKNCAWSG